MKLPGFGDCHNIESEGQVSDIWHVFPERAIRKLICMFEAAGPTFFHLSGATSTIDRFVAHLGVEQKVVDTRVFHKVGRQLQLTKHRENRVPFDHVA